MKRLILHIGVAKTGTSLIQMRLAKEQRLLLDNGFIYPDFGSSSEAAKGKVTTGNGAFLAKWLNPKLESIGCPEDWSPERIFDDSGQNNIIISSEYLMAFKEDEFFELQKIALNKGYVIEVVVYFRSIAGHSQSSYAQHVKRAQYHHSYKYFLKNDYLNVFATLVRKLDRIEKFDIKVSAFNYDKKINYLDNQFFSEVIGLEKDFSVSPRVNRSLSILELELLKEVNKLTKRMKLGNKASMKISNYLVEQVPNTKSKSSIHIDELSIINNKYKTNLIEVNNYLPDSEMIDMSDENLTINNEEDSLPEDYKITVMVFSQALKQIVDILDSK